MKYGRRQQVPQGVWVYIAAGVLLPVAIVGLMMLILWWSGQFGVSQASQRLTAAPSSGGR